MRRYIASRSNNFPMHNTSKTGSVSDNVSSLNAGRLFCSNVYILHLQLLDLKEMWNINGYFLDPRMHD